MATNSYSTPTSRFLQQLAADTDARARERYARAETLSRLGLSEAAVRENARAIELEAKAECLRLASQRAADMAHDAAEMKREGFSAGDVRVYLSRTYGKVVA